ncbi:MAG: hypothetical protein Q8881_02835, partial [Sweet potato little leaf phytoplasma]|nr:hypothetical protein [Sweet potato little leaf phytoplasma]
FIFEKKWNIKPFVSESEVNSQLALANHLQCLFLCNKLSSCPDELRPNFALGVVSNETVEFPPNFALGEVSPETAVFPPNFALGVVSDETAEFPPNFALGDVSNKTAESISPNFCRISHSGTFSTKRTNQSRRI